MNKLLTMLFLTFFSLYNYAYAANYACKDKILAGSEEGFELLASCESKCPGQCFDKGTNPSSVFSAKNVEVDDESKPIYEAKSSETACSGSSDCYSKSVGLCSSPKFFVINQSFTEVYCTKLNGYEQKTIEIAEVDSAKLSDYTNLKNLEAQKKAADAIAYKALDCGKSTIAEMLKRNAVKSLSTAQVKQLVANTSSIKDLLESGSLVSAIEEIQATEADGTLITESDKSALVSHIQSCKP